MAGDATALIGIDWGTSRQRAYRINDHGVLLESRSGDLGLSAVRGQSFDAALQPLIADWLKHAEDIPVLMCGMIGSRNGWAEAAYCDCPFGIQDLVRTLVSVTSPDITADIVGGGHVKNMRGHHDVMRGEEIQFLGLDDIEAPLLAISPGTHSKWAFLEDGRIINFRTYMTGELFAVLKDHSILGWLMPDGSETAGEGESFTAGVKDAAADPDMLHALFNVRTSALFQSKTTKKLAPYLSGLLIGYEVSGAMKAFPGQKVTVIAAPELARLYHLALTTLGIDEVCLEDADAVTAKGLWRVWQARKGAS